MPELTITDGPGAGRKVALTPNQAYSVGSDAQDSIRVAGDGIAARHLIVKALKTGGFGVKGLAGPFHHNGKEARVARLTDGDRIQLGDCVLTYADGAADSERPRAAKPQSEPEPIHKELGGFRLFEVLGKGGMGTVYRAEQVSLGREVALKVLSKDLTKDPVFVARFVAEARAAARLHHPNVVQVFDVDDVDETYFYSMELMSKGSLEDRLKKGGRVSVDEAVAMIADAARGLGFAESLRMVHRDIKPDNLMVDQHGNVKIADLGLAHGEEGEDSKKLLGTPHFMSPEQIQRQALDHRSDLYSLGCTFYRLVTGQTPFKGSSVKDILRAHLKEEAAPANSVAPEVPAEVSAIIAQMLEKDPAERFQSAQELIDALEEATAPPSRKGVLIGGIALAVVVTIGAIVYAMTREDRVIVKQGERVVITDPNAEANAKAKRESDARAEYYELLARGLEGAQKANALEAMAGNFEDTEFGSKALTDAAEIRRQVEAARLAAQQRATAIEAATAKLRGEFDAAITAKDFRGADGLLTLDSVATELRDDPAFAALEGELRPRIGTTAATELQHIKDRVEAAVQQRDAAAIETLLAQLAGIVEGPAAWPDSALPDREGLLRYVADTRLIAKSIAEEARSAAAEAAWRAVATAWSGPDGVVAAVREYRFDEAARRADAAAKTEGVSESAAATRLTHLASALRAASRFLNDFVAASADGRITVENGDPGVLLETVRFVPGGDDAGLTVRDGRKEKLIPLADLEDRLCDVFVLPGEANDDPNRAAFLACMATSLHLRDVQTYLGGIDAADDASGTGIETAFRGNAALFHPEIPRILGPAAQEWARPLLEEFRAANDTARALRAFSVRRNSAAAELLERAIANRGDTFVVRCLQ